MVITRFAPSPLVYYILAALELHYFVGYGPKNQKGKFILRIEDTDRERSTDEAVQVIIDGLKWMGLGWDEALYFRRIALIATKEVAKSLLEKELAISAIVLRNVWKHYANNKSRIKKSRVLMVIA